MRTIILCMLGFSLSCVAMAADPTLKVVTTEGEKNFTVAELRKRLPILTWTIQDPNFKKEKSFDGFSLQQVLELGGASSDKGDELVFQALDGYSPTISLEVASKHEAMIAFQEHGGKSQWQRIQQGKAWVSPAPFYVVWKEGKALPESFPWSYQLARIELVSFQKKYAKLYPASLTKGSSEYKGFITFKERCLRCHSINLQGGELAPELNIPKNVTEYWSAADLKAFILDATSYRLKSKMPVFKGSLSTAEIDDVVAYLKLMKANKIYN